MDETSRRWSPDVAGLEPAEVALLDQVMAEARTWPDDAASVAGVVEVLSRLRVGVSAGCHGVVLDSGAVVRLRYADVLALAQDAAQRARRVWR